MKSVFLLALSLLLLTVPSCKKNDGASSGISQVSPANGSSTIPTSQIFSCTPVSGARYYTFSFSDGSVSFSLSSSSDTISVPNLKTCDTYTWGVVATMADSSTVSTNPNWTFTVIGNGVSPCLLQPANNSSNLCVTPMFTWTSVAGVSSYYLQVATDNAFTNIVASTTVSADYYTIPASTLSANTQYYWCVAPAGTSSYSSTFTFLTVAPPALSSPSNNATGESRTPTFSWSSSPCASSYNVDISNVSDFSNIISTQQVTGTSYTVPSSSPLAAYTSFFWRVRVNNYSSTSGAWTFTTGI